MTISKFLMNFNKSLIIGRWKPSTLNPLSNRNSLVIEVTSGASMPFQWILKRCSCRLGLQRMPVSSVPVAIRGIGYASGQAGRKRNRTVLLCLSFLSLFGIKLAEEGKIDSVLVETIKRSMLMIQNKKYENAEISLHIALDLARKQDNMDGVIYTYDVMANLAFERKEFWKAKELFSEILQLLLSKGLEQSDPKIIHICLKLAKMYHEEQNYRLAEMGFQWCLQLLETRKYKNKDVHLLNALANDWYGEHLLRIGRFQEAAKHLKTAYDIVKEMKGDRNEEAMIILNDLGYTYFQMGQNDKAIVYLKLSLSICLGLEDNDSYIDVIRANLGVIHLYNGFTNEAASLCFEAKSNAKKTGNSDAMDQANYCLEEIRKFKANNQMTKKMETKTQVAAKA